MLRIALLPVFLTVLSLPAAEPERPRIGLALGGGGALGLSHIGVLRVLEELRVPVDCIAGTSMGSIIAGLYAAGLSPDEIEAFLVRLNWEEVLRDETPRRELYFRRKQEDQRYLFEVGVGRTGLKLGTGMAAGQKLNNLLELATLRVAEIRDFDRLPIPFRAVATDLESGQARVLDGGRLATAMRASMAVPGVFTPVILDGKVLVDGGVVNNLPVDVVRALGADVVIAVDVGASADAFQPESLRTLAGILGRTYTIAQRPGQIEALRRAEVAIQPELTGFAATQFARVAEFIPPGAAAARRQAESLSRLAVDPATYAAFLARQRRPERVAAPVDRLEVAGNQRVDSGILRARIRAQAGQPYDDAVVAGDLRRLHGIGEFEQVLAQYDPQADGTHILRYVATEKPGGPTYLKVGLHLRTHFEEHSRWGMLLDLTRMSLNSRGGEWLAEAEVGSDPRVRSEWYQPLDRGGLTFFAPSVSWGDQTQDLFSGGQRVAEYGVETRFLRLDLGWQARDYAELRVGPYWGHGRARVRTGAAELPNEDEDLGGVRAQFTADRQDRTWFTRAGSYLNLEALFSRRSLGADRDYELFSGVARDTRSWGDHTVTFSLHGGRAETDDLPAYAEFTAGGPFSLRGFQEGELRGTSYAVGGLGYRYRLAALPAALGRGVYLTANLDYGNAWAETEEADLDTGWLGGALGVGADTAAGPLFLGYGRAEGDRQQLYLSLGTSF
jgi:NTE family protein